MHLRVPVCRKPLSPLCAVAVHVPPAARELVKEVDYTLRTLAQNLLGQTQMEMPPHQIPLCFESAAVSVEASCLQGVHVLVCVRACVCVLFLAPSLIMHASAALTTHHSPSSLHVGPPNVVYAFTARVDACTTCSHPCLGMWQACTQAASTCTRTNASNHARSHEALLMHGLLPCSGPGPPDSSHGG